MVIKNTGREKRMEEQYLYQKCPFLKELSQEKREQFETYFRTAPNWLIDAFIIEELNKGTTFIRENAPADMIYFIADGLVVATDYRVVGISYDFMQFKKVYAFGGMEFIMNLDVYKTSLRTVTDCIAVKIPRAVFEKWMYSDIQAMKYEAKQMGEYLLEQARNERIFLLMQGCDRLCLLFVYHYEQYQKDGVLWVKEGQKSLADKTGLCLKSVNRVIKKLTDEGMVQKRGNKLLIGQEQYEKLKAAISEKMDME